MAISLPPDKFADIQQLLFPCCNPNLLQSLGSCLIRYGQCLNQWPLQLQRLCHIIQSDMLTFHHSPAYLFSPFYFSFSALCQLLSHLQQSPVPLQFPLPDVVIATDAKPSHWAFYF